MLGPNAERTRIFHFLGIAVLEVVRVEESH